MKTGRLLWIPRVFAIGFILSLSLLFSLDAFSGETTFVQKLGGFFLIHLIPSYILIIALIVSWRNPLIGGIIFILLGVALIFIFGFNTDVLLGYLYFSLPLIVLGALFIIFRKRGNE